MERTIPYWINSIEAKSINRGKSVLVASSENAIRGLLMHLLDLPTDMISDIEIPTGLPLVYDLERRCISLLEGEQADYNFGKRGGALRAAAPRPRPPCRRCAARPAARHPAPRPAPSLTCMRVAAADLLFTPRGEASGTAAGGEN